jgi:PadR family transcriptional regulator PadR
MTPPAAGPYLGEFEQLVLLAVLRLEDDAYGATIRRLIEDAADREVSIGAIYTTLERLHAKGYVTPHLGDPTGERGGRRRKIYTLTASGRSALSRAYTSFANMTRGLKPKLAP